MSLVERYSSMSIADCLSSKGQKWRSSEGSKESNADPLVDQLRLTQKEFAVLPGVEVI